MHLCHRKSDNMERKISRKSAPSDHLFNDIAEVAGYLWSKGWAERNSGNISVRLTGIDSPYSADLSCQQTTPLEEPCPDLSGEVLYMTGTGCRMRDVALDPERFGVLIKIGDNGKTYQVIPHRKENNNFVRPTSEMTSHLMIQQFLKLHKPRMKAVLHTHPSGLIALSHHPLYKEEDHLNRSLWSMLPETLILVPEGIGVVPYQRTGSRDLAEASLMSLKNHEVLLWEKHGCLAIGETVEDAFDLIDILSKSADIFLLCLSSGFVPEGLNDEQLEELRQKFHPV